MHKKYTHEKYQPAATDEQNLLPTNKMRAGSDILESPVKNQAKAPEYQERSQIDRRRPTGNRRNSQVFGKELEKEFDTSEINMISGVPPEFDRRTTKERRQKNITQKQNSERRNISKNTELTNILTDTLANTSGILSGVPPEYDQRKH